MKYQRELMKVTNLFDNCVNSTSLHLLPLKSSKAQLFNFTIVNKLLQIIKGPICISISYTLKNSAMPRSPTTFSHPRCRWRKSSFHQSSCATWTPSGARSSTPCWMMPGTDFYGKMCIDNPLVALIGATSAHISQHHGRLQHIVLWPQQILLSA